MFRIIQFILSFFSGSTKAKVMDAITGSLMKGMAKGATSGGGPLGELMKQFQEKGQGDIFGSWVGSGPNQAIDAKHMQEVIGDEKMEEMSQSTGLSNAQLAEELAKYLPKVVDKMTPDGKLPE